MTVTTAFHESGSANGPRRGIALTITALILLGAAAITTPAAAQDVEAPADAVSTNVAPDKGVPGAPALPPASTPASVPAGPGATSAQLPATGKAAGAAHDFSPIGMFFSADVVVRAVMVTLLLASVVTWAILLVKTLSLAFAKRQIRSSLKALRSVASLPEANDQVRRGIGALLLIEVEGEVVLSQGLPSEGIKERAAIALTRIEGKIGKRMASGTGILATIGSIGPFVGLFGTVWGIMGSFIGIANSNTTSLAVVAPGIAEALLATGIGLVAAIPAVVIYNALTRSITGYRALVGDAVALVMRHLSRDLDTREAVTYGRPSKLRLAAE
ncbi:flagellar motor protein MotA [Methylobacterium sp. Leaf94]|uniref:tonB-system energizer ExbB n=1 Tax=Methylobacterium sp. Leaf94 TaxID=1736250 RepID=UPI0007022DBB|nr:tonB-system energizer ExbB [Methylobacterium sp. Leaf94]KQU19333.1 flagellar motor protein MotA [Methylobacterium sp. Leaf94]